MKKRKSSLQKKVFNAQIELSQLREQLTKLTEKVEIAAVDFQLLHKNFINMTEKELINTYSDKIFRWEIDLGLESVDIESNEVFFNTESIEN